MIDTLFNIKDTLSTILTYNSNSNINSMLKLLDVFPNKLKTKIYFIKNYKSKLFLP